MAVYDYALTDFSGFVDVYALREAMPDVVSITLTPCVLSFSFIDYIETAQQEALDNLVRTHSPAEKTCVDFALKQSPTLMWSTFLSNQIFPLSCTSGTFFNKLSVSDAYVPTYNEAGELQQISDGTHMLSFEFVDGELASITVTESV